MTTKEILVAARALIEDEARWCQEYCALDADGKAPNALEHDEGDALAPEAVRWCAVGACQRVIGKHVRFDYAALAPLREAMGDYTIGPFNDSHSHAEVLAAFDRAIAACG